MTEEQASYLPEEDVKNQKASKQTAPKKSDGSKKRRVKVFRQDENPNAPITVLVNTPQNKREFHPGETVELSEQHIEALKLAREQSSYQIPPGSGIYEAASPKQEAQRQFPKFKIEEDFTTGTLWAIRDMPRYIVEHVD